MNTAAAVASEPHYEPEPPIEAGQESQVDPNAIFETAEYAEMRRRHAEELGLPAHSTHAAIRDCMRKNAATEAGISEDSSWPEIHFHTAKTSLGHPEATSTQDLRARVTAAKAVKRGLPETATAEQVHFAWCRDRYNLKVDVMNDDPEAIRAAINDALSNLPKSGSDTQVSKDKAA